MHLTEISRFAGMVAKAQKKGLVLIESTDPKDGVKRFRLTDGKGVVMVESTRITDAEQAISNFAPIHDRHTSGCPFGIVTRRHGNPSTVCTCGARPDATAE